MLTGKVALITGGSSGIGLGIACRFAQEGASVMVVSNDPEGVAQAVAQLRAVGAAVEGAVIDVRHASEVTAAVQDTVERFARLDIAVAAAGVGDGATRGMDDAEKWRFTLEVNLSGVYWLAQAAAHAMQQGGSIITIASQVGLVGLRGCAAYCASKGGVVNLTRALALDYAPMGIRVNCICPGAVDTPMFQASMAAAPDPVGALASHIALHPLGRIGRPEEIAGAAYFLASDDASFVTGAILPVDGGFVAQ